jgi:uncharacterized RDD family membrane protein YckC
MKCPKCGYLGFEPVDRCRNCGYEFSLAGGAPTPELAIRSGPPTIDPLADYALVDAAVPPTPPPAATPSSSDLPLFGFPAEEEPVAPAVKTWPPRSSDIRRVAVRRGLPQVADVPRRRPEERPALALELDLDPPLDLSVVSDTFAVRADDHEASDAGLFARLFAAVVDVAILAAIDAAVVYFTLQICGLTPDEIALLPKAPLAAFLLVLNGGYLIAFTVGGQTLGKMIAGIRVVSAGTRGQLELDRAVVRAAVWLLLAVPAGLGFLSALFSSDRRGLHDRFAHTRVIRL